MARIIEGKNSNIVGRNVRKLRIANGLSQQDLADRLEEEAVYICRGSISRLEDQKRTVTDIELKGLAKILQVDINVLFED